MSALALRVIDAVLRIVGVLLLVAALGFGFTDTKANGLTCGSAIVPSKLEGGALLSGDPAADEATLDITRADCGQRVLRARVVTAAFGVSGAALLWSARRLARSNNRASAGLQRKR